MRYPHIVQVIATKPFSKNLYWRAPTTFTCHEKGAKSSVLNTGEITLVFYGLHRGNVDESGDRVSNPKYSADMKQLAVAILNLAKSFIPQRKKPSTLPKLSMHWTKFDKPIDQMNPVERRAAAEKLAREALESLNKRDN